MRLCKIGGALMLALALMMSAALADVSGISLMGAVSVPGTTTIYMQLRAMNSAGTGERAQSENFVFTAGPENVQLTTGSVPDGNRGHIIVVDTSKYYYGSKNITAQNLRDIVDAYLARLPASERVMFVLANNAGQPTCTTYMSLSAAREYAKSIEMTDDNSARINTAIYQAFTFAIAPEQGAPAFNSVFIVADPDLENNKGDDHSLEESVQLRSSSGFSFDVAVAAIYRESYLQETNSTRRAALNAGFEKYEDFAKDCGGVFMKIPQSRSGVETDSILVDLGYWLYSSNDFAVDLSALAGYLPTDPAVQTTTMSISCGGAVRTLSISVDTSLLPEVQFTPTPSLYTPEPTPVVAVGQSDAKAMQAVHALIQMNYLDGTKEEFDNECYLAYIDFCKNNNIDPRDGIYEATYNLMISGTAVAAPQATPEPTDTPEPTATPEPTIPPQGYSINDQDTEDSGGYIAAMQTVLKSLNCYDEGAVTDIGRLDQATLDAVNRYCETYNWRNDKLDGVSGNIVAEIINNGPDKAPYATPEPSLRDKAKAMLAGETTIANFAIPNWAIAAACLVLLVVIVAIVLLAGAGKKKKKGSGESGAVRPNPAVTPSPTPVKRQPVQQSAAGMAGGMAFEETPTSSPYAKQSVSLEIRFGGNVRTQAVELSEGKPFTIGRRGNDAPVPDLMLDPADKSVSRGSHAALLYKNSQIYLRDTSKYHNTALNGVSVFDREGKDGVPLCNGDEIKISNHVIQIRW